MNKIIITILFLVTLQFGCSDSRQNAPNQSREIVFDDRLKVVKAGQTGGYETTSFENELKESTKKLSDNSTLNTMFDGAGNKTETRFFDNHPLIKTIILRTSARGEKQIFVYAHNGEIKNLPENTIDKALTASANELSTTAGIFQQRKTEEFSDKNKYPTTEVGILQPLPSYELLPETETEKSETFKYEISKDKTEVPETPAPRVEDDK